MIKTYTNQYHQTNLYIVGDLLTKDDYSDLVTLQRQTKKVLQCMVSSSDKSVTNLLASMDFEYVRKCYELEVTVNDLAIPQIERRAMLHFYSRDIVEYKECVKLLYHYYQETHQSINPLSLTQEQFITIVPSDVCYETVNGEITHVAFIENNEIAYVYSRNLETFKPFALDLVSQLFSKYETIFFEADNVDDVAMVVKSLFKESISSVTYDTYVRYLDK